jgi:2-oxoglutarate dehydrogenase E1 component
MQIVSPTTPAQYFHVLRRQALRRWRKPLIVMAPKGLLRHPLSVSTLDELSHGRFERVIPDGEAAHVLLCSGKIYFELLERREALGRRDVGLARIEQLYPFPQDVLKYRDVVWVQEEPENMGAWPFVRTRFPCGMRCVSRPPSSSPAAGSAARHREEQQALLARAFASWPSN